MRARANARAVFPSRVCGPALRSSLAFGERMSLGIHMGMPPSELTMFLKPEKSTIMKWPLKSTPVRSVMVRITQAAPSPRFPFLPPLESASLNFVVQPLTTVPSYIMQSEMRTRESRGIETTSIRDLSAEMCMTMVVSPRMPLAPLPPMTPFSSLRSSVPMSAMLMGLPAAKSVGMSSLGSAVESGAGPKSELTSCFSKAFRVSCRYAAPLTSTKPMMAAVAEPMVRSTRRCTGRDAWRGRSTRDWAGIQAS